MTNPRKNLQSRLHVSLLSVTPRRLRRKKRRDGDRSWKKKKSVLSSDAATSSDNMDDSASLDNLSYASSSGYSIRSAASTQGYNGAYTVYQSFSNASQASSASGSVISHDPSVSAHSVSSEHNKMLALNAIERESGLALTSAANDFSAGPPGFVDAHLRPLRTEVDDDQSVNSARSRSTVNWDAIEDDERNDLIHSTTASTLQSSALNHREGELSLSVFRERNGYDSSQDEDGAVRHSSSMLRMQPSDSSDELASLSGMTTRTSISAPDASMNDSSKTTTKRSVSTSYGTSSRLGTIRRLKPSPQDTKPISENRMRHVASATSLQSLDEHGPTLADDKHFSSVSTVQGNEGTRKGEEETLKIFVLLIAPKTRRFELIPITCNPNATTVKHVFQTLVVENASEKSLKSQNYVGLCRATLSTEDNKTRKKSRGGSLPQELIHSFTLSDYDVMDSDVFIALPEVKTEDKNSTAAVSSTGSGASGSITSGSGSGGLNSSRSRRRSGRSSTTWDFRDCVKMGNVILNNPRVRRLIRHAAAAAASGGNGSRRNLERQDEKTGVEEKNVEENDSEVVKQPVTVGRIEQRIKEDVKDDRDAVISSRQDFDTGESASLQASKTKAVQCDSPTQPMRKPFFVDLAHKASMRIRRRSSSLLQLGGRARLIERKGMVGAFRLISICAFVVAVICFVGVVKQPFNYNERVRSNNSIHAKDVAAHRATPKIVHVQESPRVSSSRGRNRRKNIVRVVKGESSSKMPLDKDYIKGKNSTSSDETVKTEKSVTVGGKIIPIDTTCIETDKDGKILEVTKKMISGEEVRVATMSDIDVIREQEKAGYIRRKKENLTTKRSVALNDRTSTSSNAAKKEVGADVTGVVLQDEVNEAIMEGSERAVWWENMATVLEQAILFNHYNAV